MWNTELFHITVNCYMRKYLLDSNSNNAHICLLQRANDRSWHKVWAVLKGPHLFLYKDRHHHHQVSYFICCRII